MSKKITVVCGCGNEFTLDNAPRRRLRAERDDAIARLVRCGTEAGEAKSQLSLARRQVAHLTEQIQRQAQQIIDERSARKMPEAP